MIPIKVFWNWARDADTGSRALYLDGVIAAESWFGDEVTPAAFRKELYADEGDITVYINSPGGDVFAASQIYTMLIEYPDNVTVKVDGLAASAASVIVMAGTTVLMAPTSSLMIHNPSTIAWGDSAEMQKAVAMLDEVKQTIITAYELRTGLPRDKLSAMMDAETWIGASRAVEMGFADGLIVRESDTQAATLPGGVSAMSRGCFIFNQAAITNALLAKLKPQDQPLKLQQPKTPVADLDKRLALLRN